MHLANAWELHVAHACNMLGFELGKCLSLVVVCACVCFQIGQFQGTSKQNTRGCRRRLEAYMSATLMNSSAVHFHCIFPVCQSCPKKFHWRFVKNAPCRALKSLQNGTIWDKLPNVTSLRKSQLTINQSAHIYIEREREGERTREMEIE